MIEFKESKFYKLLQDFFINNDKETFIQFLAEFYNRTEGIINKNNIQDEIIKELREMFLLFNEEGIDENIVREKVNYFIENSNKIQDIITKLITNTNNIKNINSQLDNKANIKIENFSNLNYYDGCVFTIVDDDGERLNIFNKLKPLLDKKGKKCTFAMQTGAVNMENKLTNNDIELLQSEGYELVAHGYQHRDLTSISYEDREFELKNAKEYAIKNNYKNTDTIVYPFGFDDNETNKEIKAHTSKYFKYGVNAYGIDQHGNDNNEVLDNYYIKRLDFNNKTLEELKAIVDRNITKKTLIVILIHSWMEDIDWVKFEALIDYVISKSIPIVPLSEAINIKGNALQVGEYRTGIIIRNDGKIAKKGFNEVLLDGSPELLNKPITSFDNNSKTYFNVGNGSHSPFGNFGGIVEVVRIGNWGYMKYKIYFNNIEFIKQWDADNSTWKDWAIVQNTNIGTTSQRPLQWHTPTGLQYYDTDLGKPIWHKGNGVWIDATGTTV